MKSSSQEPHPDYSSDLWTLSRSYLTRIQRPRGPRLGPVHSVHRYYGPRHLATFEPNPAVYAFQEASSSKDTWGRVPLVVHGLLCRPSLSGTPTVTFCSVHIHNVVAQKRDASTDLLHRLHAHTPQHNVDFIGGYFSMSAFSSVGDVFSDPEFSAPSNSSLWRRGALEDSNRECTGFLIMPKRPCEWRVDSHGCCKFNNADLELGPRDTTAHLPLFLHLRTTNFPGLDSITRTEQAQQRRLEREATEHERRQCRRRLTQPPTS